VGHSLYQARPPDTIGTAARGVSVARGFSPATTRRTGSGPLAYALAGMTVNSARLGVAASAVCLGIGGAALLFAPHELATATGASGPDVIFQLLGATLLAQAAMNHIARGSMLGGIYGRAIVTADQVHFTIGAIALGKHAWRAPVEPVVLALTAAYVGAAIFFNLMLFRGVDEAPAPGLR
jgi:hypothetical protein